MYEYAYNMFYMRIKFKNKENRYISHIKYINNTLLFSTYLTRLKYIIPETISNIMLVT